MKKNIYNENFSHYFYGVEEKYLELGKPIPNVSFTAMEGILSSDFGDEEGFIDEAYKYLLSVKNEFKLDNKNLYLCIALEGKGANEKMNDHFKLWKQIKDFNVQNYKLSYEYKIKFSELNIYCGCLKFDLDNLKEILEFIYYHEKNAFIYVSDNNRLLDEEETEVLFNYLFDKEDKNIVSVNLNYDKFYNLFEAMIKDECIIRKSFDGESIGIDIFKKGDSILRS